MFRKRFVWKNDDLGVRRWEREKSAVDGKKSAREYLIESALELTARYPVEKITVEMIVRNCHLSKRTFYNHFRDKYDLFLDVFASEMRKFFNRGKQGTLRDFLEYSGRILWKYPDFLSSMLTYKGQNNFTESIYYPIMECVLRIIQDNYGDYPTKELIDVTKLYLLGVIYYVNSSLVSGHPQPLDEAMEVFVKAAPDMLKKYF